MPLTAPTSGWESPPRGAGRFPRTTSTSSSIAGTPIYPSHIFVLSGVVSLPVDFWFSGVMRATSGAHFSATATTVDYDGIASRRPRGTERNEFTGPSSFNLDLRVEKRFHFGKRTAVSILAEGFNVTNAGTRG